jgi:hypothetical protein
MNGHAAELSPNCPTWVKQLSHLSKREARKYKDRFVFNLNPDGAFSYERDHCKIEEEAKYSGFFRALANTGLDGGRALLACRRKEAIENSFGNVKNRIGMKPTRAQNAAATDGKLFCAFILNFHGILAAFIKVTN